MFQCPPRITDRSLLALSNMSGKGKQQQRAGSQRFLRWQRRMPLHQWDHTVLILSQERSSCLTTGKLTCLAWRVKPSEKKCQCVSVQLHLEQQKSTTSNGVNKAYRYYARHKICAVFRSITLSLPRKMLDEVALIFSMKQTVLKQAFHLSEKQFCKECIWLSLENNPIWFLTGVLF